MENYRDIKILYKFFDGRENVHNVSSKNLYCKVLSVLGTLMQGDTDEKKDYEEFGYVLLKGGTWGYIPSLL